MSLYAFDFRDQLYAPWEQARGPLIEQLDLLYAGLNAAVVTKDPTTGLVTGIGGDIFNNVAAAQVQVNLSTNITGVLPVAYGGTGGTMIGQLPIVLTPNVALFGNGTVGNPLTLSTDGSSITVNGSNQLVATIPSAWGFVLKAVVAPTTAQVKSLDTVPLLVIAGVANKIILPIGVVGTVVSGSGYASASSGALVYGNAINPAITGTFPIAEVTASKTFVGYATGLTQISEVASSTSNYPVGTAVYLKSTGANTGTPTGNSTTVTCYYIVIDP